jgi:phage tail-like protein
MAGIESPDYNAGQTVQSVSHFSNIGSEPMRNFKFAVSINHTITSRRFQVNTPINFKLGFTSVSGFSVSTAPIPYRAGNMNTTPQMLPGQTSFNPISFARGSFLGDDAQWMWFSELFTVHNGAELNPVNGGRYFRGDVEVFLLRHPANSGSYNDAFKPIARWKIYNAWPQMFSLGDLNAGDNSFLVENMTLAHEGWDFWPY